MLRRPLRRSNSRSTRMRLRNSRAKKPLSKPA
jgi:hypothetical protein